MLDVGRRALTSAERRVFNQLRLQREINEVGEGCVTSIGQRYRLTAWSVLLGFSLGAGPTILDLVTGMKLVVTDVNLEIEGAEVRSRVSR